MADRNFTVNMVIGAKDRATRVVNRFRAALGALNNRVTQVAAALTAFFGLRAVTNLFSNAINSAADFETALAQVQARTDATSEEISRVRREVNRLASTTSFGDTQILQGFQALVDAGLSVDEALQALGPTLNTAKANAVGLADSAAVVARSLRTFNAEASESGRIGDVLTAASNRTAASFSTLADDLEDVGPIAAQANLSLEQTVAAIAALRDAGLSGERVTSGLEESIREIQDPASDASQALADLGIQSNNLGEVIAGLQNAGDSAGGAIREFADEAQPALQALVNSSEGAIGALVEALNKADGEAKETAETFSGTVNSAVGKVSGAWDVLRKKLVQPLLPLITEQAEQLSERLRELARGNSVSELRESLAGAFRDGVDAIKAFIAQSGGVDGLISSVSDGVSRLSDLFSGLKGAANQVDGATQIAFNSVTAFLNGVAAAVAGAVNVYAQANQALVKSLNQLGVASDQQLREAQNAARATSEAWRRAQERVNQDVQDIAAGYQQMAGQATSAGEESEKAARRQARAMRFFRQEVANTALEAARVKASVDEVSDSVGQAGDQASDAAKQFESIAGFNERLEGILDETAITESALQRIQLAKDRLNEGADSASDFADRIRNMPGLPPDLRQQLLRLVGATDDASDQFRDLQDQIRRAGSDEALQELRDQIIALGDDGKLSESQVASLLQGIRDRSEAATSAMQKLGDAIAEASSSTELASAERQVNEAFDEGNITLEERAQLLDRIERKTKEAQQAQSGQAESSKQAADAAKEAGEAAEKAGDQAEEAGEQGSGGFGALAGALDQARNRMRDLSEAAAAAFRDRRGLRDATTDAEDFQGRIENINKELGELRTQTTVRTSGNSITQWLQDMRSDALKTERAFLRQKQSAKELQKELENGDVSADILNQSAEDLRQQFSLLDDQDLSGLESALQSAQQRVRSLRSEAESTLQSLQDELARSRGEFEQLERQRVRRERQELQSQLAEAQAVGDQQAVQDLRRALGTFEQVAEQRLEEARQREREAQRQEREAAAPATQQGGQQQRPTLGDQPAGQVIELRGPDGERTRIGVDGEDDARQLVDTLRKAGLRTG